MSKMMTFLVSLIPNGASHVELEEVEAISKENCADFINGKWSNPEIVEINEFDSGFSEDSILQTASTDLLLAAAAGRIDLNRKARVELANRGIGTSGKWVGFEQARKIHGLEA